MKEDCEAKQRRLRSGVPCVKHGCVKCCIETRMPLSRLDKKRVLKMGYMLNDFTKETKEGWLLKNRSSRCVFLSENGCKIYQYRPEGCQLYPLVYDQDLQKPTIDHLCPYGYEFEVRKNDVKKLMALLKRLEH